MKNLEVIYKDRITVINGRKFIQLDEHIAVALRGGKYSKYTKRMIDDFQAGRSEIFEIASDTLLIVKYSKAFSFNSGHVAYNGKELREYRELELHCLDYFPQKNIDQYGSTLQPDVVTYDDLSTILVKYYDYKCGQNPRAKGLAENYQIAAPHADIDRVAKEIAKKYQSAKSTDLLKSLLIADREEQAKEMLKKGLICAYI